MCIMVLIQWSSVGGYCSSRFPIPAHTGMSLNMMKHDKHVQEGFHDFSCGYFFTNLSALQHADHLPSQSAQPFSNPFCNGNC